MLAIDFLVQLTDVDAHGEQIVLCVELVLRIPSNQACLAHVRFA